MRRLLTELHAFAREVGWPMLVVLGLALAYFVTGFNDWWGRQ